jgi:hypothetical protein
MIASNSIRDRPGLDCFQFQDKLFSWGIGRISRVDMMSIANLTPTECQNSLATKKGR